MKAIILGSMKEFDALERRIHEAMVKSGAHQTRWCYPKVHPDGRIALVVERRMVKYLTNEERKRVTELDESWFPKIEEDNVEAIKR